MYAKEKAAAIRKALKEQHGWTSRDVSVRLEPCTYDSAIRVTIKRADIPGAVVREIAEAHESLSRDEATGEILGGGNTYVTVRYAHTALRPLVSLLEDLLSPLAATQWSAAVVASLLWETRGCPWRWCFAPSLGSSKPTVSLARA